MITDLFYSHIRNINRDSLHAIRQEVSGRYTYQVLHTDKLKMALLIHKVSETFEKRAPGDLALTLRARQKKYTFKTPALQKIQNKEYLCTFGEHASPSPGFL